VHADSAPKALVRLEQLVLESGVRASKELIGDAVNVIVFIQKTPAGRRIKELVQVEVIDGAYKITPLNDELAECAHANGEEFKRSLKDAA